jgi:hypothetical protein
VKRTVHVAVSGSRLTVGDEGAGFQRASRERSEQLTRSEQSNPPDRAPPICRSRW